MKKKIITFLICLILLIVLVFLSVKLTRKETKENNLEKIKLADATLTSRTHNIKKNLIYSYL